jgi:hypothetical protein
MNEIACSWFQIHKLLCVTFLLPLQRLLEYFLGKLGQRHATKTVVTFVLNTCRWHRLVVGIYSTTGQKYTKIIDSSIFSVRCASDSR